VDTPSWYPDNGEVDGELDDLDRELLGEGSADEDGAPRVGDDGDSSDESADDDGDEDENLSTYDGANGYARHESSSPVPSGAAERREDGDEAMEE
jgi:hypothetical protein